MSQLNSLTRVLVLSFFSCLGPIFPSSILRPSSLSSGRALHQSLLCLLGDFARQVLSESSVTVSLNETTGSDSWISILAKISLRSLRQISMWSSPEPAITCSYVLLS